MIKFLKFTKRPWVQNEHIPIERHFIFLLETNNALRAVTPTYFYSDHHLYGVFGNKQHFSDKLTDYECDLWSNVFFLVGLPFYSGRYYFNFGRHDSGSGRHDFRRDDLRVTWSVTEILSRIVRGHFPRVFSVPKSILGKYFQLFLETVKVT